MLLKVRGIVLHHINYSESSLILHLYTDQKGRMAIIVPGARSRSKSRKISLYHNLSLLELEVYYKDSRELQQIKEARPEIPMSAVTGDPVKSTIALFLAELLYRTLKEEESNPDLFSFLENSISFFEMTDDGTANFHLWFMIHLTRFLGFFPYNNHQGEGEWFNLRSGRFTSFPPEAASRLEPGISDVLAQFLRSGLKEAISIPLNRKQRNELLSGLIEFYKIHLLGMGEIKSYSVLQEIFM